MMRVTNVEIPVTWQQLWHDGQEQRLRTSVDRAYKRSYQDTINASGDEVEK